MDIDKLFKRPNLPASALKKGTWTPQDAANLASKDGNVVEEDAAGPAAGPSRLNGRQTTVRDAEDEQDAYGPSLGDDSGYDVQEGPEDDEDDRFFGGGLTDQQQKILEILDRDEGDGKASSSELSDLRKQLVRFEKAINRNQEMRMKFSNDPKKFIDSEADLDAEIRALVILTTNPRILYAEAVKNGVPASLCSLLSHENEDIVSAVVTLIEELTDDDVLEGVEDDPEQSEAAMKTLVDSLISNQVVELLLSNLERFLALMNQAGREESSEADEQGVFHTFSALENLANIKSEIAFSLGANPKFIATLLKLINKKGSFDANKGYAAELLAILSQHVSSDGKRNLQTIGQKNNTIEEILKALSGFRKSDPIDGEEEEFMENLFDALCALLADDTNKSIFLDFEGVELMVLMTKTKFSCRLKAFKVLDHAMSGAGGKAACARFVEALGLKSLFQLLMGKSSGKKKAGAAEPTAEDEEHVLSIMVSLINALGKDTVERIRFLAKFVEKDYEKLDRLLELRERFREKLERADRARLETGALDLEEDEEQTKEIQHLERLESGLFALQLLDYVLAWVCVEDDGVKEHAQLLLSRRGQSLKKDVVENLQAYYYDIGDSSVSVEGAGQTVPVNGDALGETRAANQKEVIIDLVNLLLADE